MRSMPAILLLLSLRAASSPRDALSDLIDREMEKKWAAAGLREGAPADDYEFLRRIHLDLLGRLPHSDEIREFVKAPKRAEAIHRLLESPEASRFWADRWIRLLIAYDFRETDPLVVDFPGLHAWLSKAYSENRPYDRFVTALVAAEGDRSENPETNFLAKFADPKRSPADVAGRVTGLFLGVQIQCAQCHDHPHEKWTQKDFWGMAAFFGNLRARSRKTFDGMKTKLVQTEPLEVPVVGIADEGWTMTPKFLDGKTPTKGEPPRQALAKFMITMEGRRFAKAFVEREWTHFMGEGCGDLMEPLARDFEGSGYDVRRFAGGVLNSRAYQMSCRTEKGSAHRKSKPQGPIEFLNNFEYALDLSTFFETLYKEFTKNKDLPESYRSPVVFRIYMGQFVAALLGREGGSVGLALKLMNGKDLQGLVRAHWGHLKRTLEKYAEPAERLEEIFLTLASRPPGDEERTRYLEHIRRKGGEASAYEDVFWVLLNSPDFYFNH